MEWKKGVAALSQFQRGSIEQKTPRETLLNAFLRAYQSEAGGIFEVDFNNAYLTRTYDGEHEKDEQSLRALVAEVFKELGFSGSDEIEMRVSNVVFPETNSTGYRLCFIEWSVIQFRRFIDRLKKEHGIS